MKHLSSNNLDLLLTYQLTQYSSTKRTQIEPVSGDTLQGHYKPNVNTVLIGLRVSMPQKIAVTTLTNEFQLRSKARMTAFIRIGCRICDLIFCPETKHWKPLTQDFVMELN